MKQPLHARLDHVEVVSWTVSLAHSQPFLPSGCFEEKARQLIISSLKVLTPRKMPKYHHHTSTKRTSLAGIYIPPSYLKTIFFFYLDPDKACIS